MKKVIKVIIVFFILGIVFPINLVKASVDQSIKAGLLFDYSSGQVIWEKDSNKRVPVASLSKLLSIYVIEDNLKKGNIKLNDKVTISENVARISNNPEYAGLRLQTGEVYSVEELINAAVIISANDATLALAEYTKGSENNFVASMKKMAKKFGIQNRYIYNATGLPQRNYFNQENENEFTPNEMGIIAFNLIKDFPQILDISKRNSITIKNMKYDSTNKLLDKSNYLIDGLKTGTGERAGNCFISTGLVNGHRVITVILGANDDNERFSQTLSLYDYLNNEKKTVTFFSKKGNNPINRTSGRQRYLSKDITIWLDKTNDEKNIQLILTGKNFKYSSNGLPIKVLQNKMYPTVQKKSFMSFFL